PDFIEKYDAEIDVDGHTYRRSKSTGTWCRFTAPTCGIDLPEVKSPVDDALAKKPPVGPAGAPTVEGAREPGGKSAEAQVPEGQQRAPSGGVFEWPPRAPEGPAPTIDSPTGAEWRYRDYRYRKFSENPTIREADLPSFADYKRRFIDPALTGGRPGRA